MNPTLDGDEPAAPRPLPRRARSGAEPREPVPDTGSDADPGHDPDGRRYSDGDAATLNRLLTGLRDI